MQKKLLQTITVLSLVGIWSGSTPSYAETFRCFMYPDASCGSGTGGVIFDLPNVATLNNAILHCQHKVHNRPHMRGLKVQVISDIKALSGVGLIEAVTECYQPGVGR